MEGSKLFECPFEVNNFFQIFSIRIFFFPFYNVVATSWLDEIFHEIWKSGDIIFFNTRSSIPCRIKDIDIKTLQNDKDPYRGWGQNIFNLTYGGGSCLWVGRGVCVCVGGGLNVFGLYLWEGRDQKAFGSSSIQIAPACNLGYSCVIPHHNKAQVIIHKH